MTPASESNIKKSGVIPIIALVGRPNVGKSTLFNRLVGRRAAVVSDEAGTTRDVLEASVSWMRREYRLMDMAGVEMQFDSAEQNTPKIILDEMQKKVAETMNEAHLIAWVVDVNSGITSEDMQIAQWIRRQNKPIILVVNKCDNPNKEANLYDFSALGVSEMVGVSSIHGRGMDDFIKAVNRTLGEKYEQFKNIELEYWETDKVQPEKELKISIIGRPNVGKSTLLNALAENERSVVSPIAGTTRDSVDMVIPSENLFHNVFTKWQTVRIIDTAGIRKRGKVGNQIESWSVVRSYEAIESCDVVLCMVEATEGLTHQDLQVMQKAVDLGKAMVLVVNKWDLILARKKAFSNTVEDAAAQEELLESIRAAAPFLHWIQVVFVSALEEMNLESLGKIVLRAYNAWNIKISDEDLKNLTIALRKIPALKNLMSIKLVHNQPPVFHLIVEGKSIPHFSVHRQVENILRENFELGSTPIKIWSVPTVEKH